MTFEIISDNLTIVASNTKLPFTEYVKVIKLLYFVYKRLFVYIKKQVDVSNQSSLSTAVN